MTVTPQPHDTHSDRRHFLKQSLALAAAGAGGAVLAPEAVAAKPIVRTGKPYMKLSLAAYSYRKYLDFKNPTMTMPDFITEAASLNLDGCELTSYWFANYPGEIDTAYLLSLKEQAFRLGLDISGTAINNNFCLPEGDAREKSLEHTRRWIDYAAIIGAPVIRIFAGYVPQGETFDTALERCVAGVNESLDYAAQKGVVLAIENHGGITAKADGLLAICERVQDSPWFGVNFDSGNFRTADPYGDLAKIAPYAVNAQIKVDMKPADRPEEPADLDRIIKILDDAGYRGYVVLEYEGKGEPKTEIPKYIDQLRKAIGR
ncbi:endonuclease 4 [Symmachiella dynata]|uniref:sugar phosphate isomerase/epimerase family protein n=1 Tax=Symmachiella dynata TaxID=2527995 RepID=UPI00118C7C17|nr:sugar phosphate isomerase/epimerase family protein [Symmachiella dynata]QDT51963.1 endonuclease 4 [Symmachiella dynata]